VSYGSSTPRLLAVEGPVAPLALLMARWGRLSHDAQVELMLSSFSRSEAVCSNPSLSPAAITEALATDYQRDAQRIAENILCGPRFADLPLRLVVRCAGLAGFDFDYHAGMKGLALVLASRPAVARALVAQSRPSPAALAALCMPDIDWSTPAAAALIDGFLGEVVDLVDRTVQGRTLGPLWAAPRPLPSSCKLSQMRSPRQIGALARLVVEGTAGGADAGPRPLLIATGLLANPWTPPSARTDLETLVGRACAHAPRLLGPSPDQRHRDRCDRHEVAAAFSGVTDDVWAAAELLVRSGFDGPVSELAATAARLV
jgi:hypothetical protein